MMRVKASRQTGAEPWRAQKPGSPPNNNTLYAAAAAPNGDFFVAGSLAKPREFREAGDAGFSVLRLRGSDGLELWWQEIGNYGWVKDIAVDATGDVIAVGRDSWRTFLAMQLLGSDGELLWRAPTPRRAFYTADEGAEAVTLDPAGDVFVAGSRADPAWPRSSSTSAITTLKLSGATGSVLCQHDVSNTQNSGGNCCLRRDIAIGSDGHVVTIGVLGTYHWQNAVAVKLSSETGALMWRREPDTEAPVIGQVSIGDDGSVAVASSEWTCSNGAGYCGRYTVAKLRGRSGLGFFAGCGDEIDNDEDGAVDELEDLDCASASSPTESPACQNGIDDDGDSRIDLEDAGCADPSAATESPACENGVDDDGDGRIDHPADPGCASPARHTESPACDDGIDDDGDGLADHPQDPGCRWPSSLTESPACQDGWDNDGDRSVDFDGGTTGSWGSVSTTPDPDCTRPDRDSEGPAPRGCGLGYELAVLLVLLRRSAYTERSSRQLRPVGSSRVIPGFAG